MPGLCGWERASSTGLRRGFCRPAVNLQQGCSKGNEIALTKTTIIAAALGAALLASGGVGVARQRTPTPAATPAGATITVRDTNELRQALARARPGTTIRLAPGRYGGGHFVRNLRGAPGKPIVIAGADPRNPPVIAATGTGMQLSDPAYVELRDLTFTGASANTLNIDDGGEFDQTAHHITLKNLRLGNMVDGPGYRNGIKLSGVTDFRLENCVIEYWGSAGQGVDVVGCRRGVFQNCVIRHRTTKDGVGILIKGGTSDMVVRGCRFYQACERAVALGGLTDLRFFRPRLPSEAERAAGTPRLAEARNLRVEGCTFVGGGSPVAFVGVDGADVRFNTIYRPKRFVLRILQETQAPGFVPSRRGRFTDNLIVWRASDWAETGVAGAANIGPGTAPETFTFARNFWYCQDDPAKSRPVLPAREIGGVYGQDPRLRDPDAAGDLRPRPNSPAVRFGAHAAPRANAAKAVMEAATR